MDVITTPSPSEDVAPNPVTGLPSPAARHRLSDHWIWAIGAACLVVGIVLGAMTMSALQSGEAAAPDLDATLEWMFTASLTYSAVTEDGQDIPPPARSVEVREIEILDPVRGPILAIVSLDHTASTEVVAYEIATSRQGRSWTVEAVPLAGRASQGEN